MNGTQSPDPQKALNANSNGSNSNNSSLAAKKRKKDLKPIITMEGTNQTEGLHYTPKRFQTAGELLRALRYRQKNENGLDAHRSLLIV
ncbi:uncharacterized protein FIESC28_03519 [Fusarium coffeatum]|uniref:Uncharacterized protein n=1 Tax=Fusarium coffeatum TaxID=231269 RepID=A0A366S335_9HYPO|nr:uncharacterized protein FIESC28_03519 [Fusarium coffeatum]RBR23723.1 hypothetical protein FIESC28_03519 [Fusarium coffeatum]